MIEPVWVEATLSNDEADKANKPTRAQAAKGSELVYDSLAEGEEILNLGDMVDHDLEQELWEALVSPEVFECALQSITASAASADAALNSAFSFIEESKQRIEDLEAQHKAGLI